MTATKDEEAAQSDDPRRLIEQVVAMGAEFPGPAEDLLLSWILSLAPETDARLAARRLISKYQGRLDEVTQDRPVAKLWRLLTETANAAHGPAQRRGGASARRR